MKKSLAVLAAALLVALAVPAQGAMVAKMTLGEMTTNAATIARVTVLDVEESTVALGGGALPITIYTLKVDEPIKGDFDTSKGNAVIEVRMVGSVKPEQPVNGLQHISALPELPRLQLGHDYLLFATEPSAIGLSAPVGLGQGTFGIYLDGKVEMAANELDNAGLFAGPVTYDELTDAVRAELGQ